MTNTNRDAASDDTRESREPRDESQRTLAAAVRSDLQRQRVVFQEVTQALTTARPTPLSPPTEATR